MSYLFLFGLQKLDTKKTGFSLYGWILSWAMLSVSAIFNPSYPISLSQLVHEVAVERRWGQRGGPWEFNLRDMFRWCQLMQADQSPGFFNPGQHVALVYADKMRTEADKAQVMPYKTNPQ